MINDKKSFKNRLLKVYFYVFKINIFNKTNFNKTNILFFGYNKTNILWLLFCTKKLERKTIKKLKVNKVKS
jgi:hypothetical protein